MSSTAVITNFKQGSYTSFRSCCFICSLSEFCYVLLEFAYFEYNERHIIESTVIARCFLTLTYFIFRVWVIGSEKKQARTIKTILKSISKNMP